MRSKVPRPLSLFIRSFVSPSMAVALAGAGCLGCNSSAPDAETSGRSSALSAANVALNGSDAPGAQLGVYRAFWPKRDDTDLANRVSKIVSLLGGTSARLTSPETLRSIESAPFDDAKFQVSYKDQFDDLAVRVPSRLPDAQPDKDIGESAAHDVAAKAIKSLYASGVATDGQYSLTDFGTGHRRRGEYAGDGTAVKKYVVEYRFRSLRKLNNIDMANNGIVIGVTPSGDLSSIRIGGAQVDSVIDSSGERPTSVGRVFTRAVDGAAVERRFQSEIVPDGKKAVISKSIMYVVPRKAAESLIEPVIAYRYAQTFDAVIEPSHTIGYSLEDSQKAPRDLDAD